MARVVDITDKLNFDQNPKIMIKGQQLEVNSDVKSILEIMGLFSSKSEVDAAIGAYEILFSKEEREKINKMNLLFPDFMKVIELAMNLVLGEDEQGE